MSKERPDDRFRFARTSILDVLKSNLRNSYASNSDKTYEYYPQSSCVRGTSNLLEGAHESEEYRTSKSLNIVRDSDSLSSSRLGKVSMSSALEDLQNYGSFDRSPVHSQDWGLDFLKNIDSNKKAAQFSSSMKNSADSYKRSPDSRYFSDTPSCSTLSSLNLKTVDEEDEFLYGDSNSMPEIPKSVKKNPDLEDTKNEHMWSDEDDMFQDSPEKKSNPEANKNTSVWNLRNQNATPNSPQVKFQNQSVPVGRKMGSETMETQKSTPIPTQEIKSVSHDIGAASGSVNKAKYHAAAQILKKQSMEKSRNLMNENIDSLHHDDFHVKEESFRSDPEKNVGQLPKAFSQKDQQEMKNFTKGSDRKRVYSQEDCEQELKHPRYNSPRDSSPSRHSPYDSSRHRSPLDDYRYRPSSYPMHKSHPSDFKYRVPPYHRKSPSRDYERHSFEYSPRRGERRHYSRSPPRRSRERSPGYYKYKERFSRKRSRERSRSPEYYRYKEKSPMKRSRERSRSPGYYKSRDRSLEREYKKKSYKSYEMSHKDPSKIHPKLKKKKDYNSGDSFCSLSLGSESDSSDRSSNSYNGKEKGSRSRPKKKNDKDLKSEVEERSDTAVDKNVDKPIVSKDFSQNIEQICNFKDKTSEATEITDNIPKLFNKDEEDKLINIVKMFENSQILTELVEGVQDPASNLASSVPSMVDSHNLSLPVQNSAVINMPFPHSYPVGPIQSNIPIHYPPSQVPFPPVAFRPPLVMQATPPTSMLAPFPHTVQQSSLVEVPRYPEVKEVAKRRPQTLRPISLQKDNENTLSAPQKQIETKEIKASKDNVIVNIKQNDKTTSELFKAHAELIEKYKKLKAERHLVRIKVNSSVGDLCEMRKVMDEGLTKKKSAADAVIHSKCKQILSGSQDNLSVHVKEAKRLEDELNRLKAKMPKELQSEISNIKVGPVKEVSNIFYSGFDKGSHTCFICYQQFNNLSGILEHFHSQEHIELMDSQDKEWKIGLNKNTELESGKKLSLKPVQGIEFMKPVSGFYCTICSETIFDNSSAESHLKSHDHFVNFNDYILKHPLYERKCLLKSYVMHSKKTKLKEKQAKQEQLINRKKLEAVEEKVKEMIKEQVSKEKVVDELKEIDDKAIASNNQSSGGIKLTLTAENENVKEDSKEQKEDSKDTKEKSTSKAAQKVYIGKAPNFKARPKPWYKRDIYQKNENESDASSSALSKDSILTGMENLKGNVSFPDKKSIKHDSKAKALGKIDQLRKTVESTCLTEEASEKHPVVSENSSKEKLPVTKDPVVNQAIKNILLGTDSSMHKDIPLSEIKLPEIPVKTAKDSSANPTSHGESHNPLPMEIEESPETHTPALPPVQKLTAEEEKDFYILGINREDFRPLVVPVPPPSSLMNPNFYKTVPPPTVVCNAKTVPPPTLVCDTSIPPPTLVCDTSVPPPNFNINIAQPITVPPPPLPLSAHLPNALNSKQQSPEFKPAKRHPTLITIVPTNASKIPDSPTNAVSKNVDASPVKPSISPTKTVSKNVSAIPVKLNDSPMATRSKNIDATPIKLPDSPKKTVSKNINATPVKLAESPKKIDATPVKLADSPKKTDATPVKLADSPKKTDVTPVKLADLPKKTDATPIKLPDSPAKTVSKNIDATPIKLFDSPMKTVSKNIDAAPIKLSDSKTESKKVDNPPIKKLEDESPKLCVKPYVNSSSGTGETSKEQNSFQSSETFLKTSKSDLSEVKKINCETSVKLNDPKNNLCQSESIMEIEAANECDITSKVKDTTVEYEGQDEANSKVCFASKEENKSSSMVKVQKEKQLKSEQTRIGEDTLVCEITSEISRSVSSEIEDVTNSKSKTPLTVPSDNLTQSKSAPDFAVENRDTASKNKSEPNVEFNENSCSIIGDTFKEEEQNLSQFCELVPETSECNSSGTENIAASESKAQLIVQKNYLSKSESVKQKDACVDITSENKNTTKCETEDEPITKLCDSEFFVVISEDEEDNTNSVSEKVIEKSNTSNEKQADTTSKEILIDNDSSCCIIGEIANEEQSVSECFETNLDISKSDLSKVDNTFKSDALTSWKVVETSSESVMEIEAEISTKIEKDAKCEEITPLDVSADDLDQSESYMEIDDEDVSTTSEKEGDSNKINCNQIEGQVASVKIENISEISVSSEIEMDTKCEKITPLNVPVDNLDQSESVMETDCKNVSTTSEKQSDSIKISCDQTEGQVASVKFENISETFVSSKIETDIKCEKITQMNVPVSNLDQSETVMETDAEDVSIISDKDNESIKINQEDSTKSLQQDSISSTVEEQVIEQNVPGMCETVSDISDFSNNLSQPESAMKTDIEDVAKLSENTSNSIKDRNFSDFCNKSQNDVPIKVCVANEEHSCNSDVKSTVGKESALKSCKIVSENCESTSSEIGSTLNNATVDELSSPVTKSASVMEVDNSTNVASKEVNKSIEKCTLQDCNDESGSLKSNEVAENSAHDNSALLDKECDNKANIFLSDDICDTGKESDSKTSNSEEAQSCMDPNPKQMQIHEYSSEEKSVMEVSPSITDTIQVKDENSTQLNQNSPTKQLLNEDPNVKESDMEVCSSTIQELIDLKEAQQSNQELDLQSSKVTSSPAQNCEGSTEIKMSLSTPESSDEIKATSDKISGSTQEVNHQESSAEVIVQDQDAENKVVENEGAKATLPDNTEEIEMLSKSDTDTEEYEEEEP